MAHLYVDQPGAKLELNNALITVTAEGATLATARPQEIETVILMDNCSVTSSALSTLLYNYVPLFVMSRNGYALGRLDSLEPKNIQLRKIQYELSDNQEFAAEMCARFVWAKIINMRTLLMRYVRSDSNALDSAPTDQLKQLASSAGDCRDYQQLLGIEGSATKAYFDAFSTIIAPPFAFCGRNRRPPLDPVNAMLGFAYALLETRIIRSVVTAGLDPYCGFLHKEHYGRNSLALDILEEFRSVIADSLVVNACNRKILKPDVHFESRDGGVFLNEKGREAFYPLFIQKMSETVQPEPNEKPASYNEICDMQARKLSDCLKNKSFQYKPFRIR